MDSELEQASNEINGDEQPQKWQTNNIPIIEFILSNLFFFASISISWQTFCAGKCVKSDVRNRKTKKKQ